MISVTKFVFSELSLRQTRLSLWLPATRARRLQPEAGTYVIRLLWELNKLERFTVTKNKHNSVI